MTPIHIGDFWQFLVLIFCVDSKEISLHLTRIEIDYCVHIIQIKHSASQSPDILEIFVRCELEKFQEKPRHSH